MPNLTDAELDELEKLAQVATKGPWIKSGIRSKFRTLSSDFPIQFHSVGPDCDPIAQILYNPDHHTEMYGNANFIAALHPCTALRLIEEIRELRARLAPKVKAKQLRSFLRTHESAIAAISPEKRNDKCTCGHQRNRHEFGAGICNDQTGVFSCHCRRYKKAEGRNG